MSKHLGFLLFSKDSQNLDCFEEEKYKDLAAALESSGYTISTLTWKKDNIAELRLQSAACDALLVWINPVDRALEEGSFENFLREFHDEGKYLSTHPDTVLKIGTKSILHSLRGTRWVSDVVLHSNRDSLFSLGARLGNSQARILKQNRGNGGIGVFKVLKNPDTTYTALEARSNTEQRIASLEGLVDLLGSGVSEGNPVIETAWNTNHANGMIRCYFCDRKIVGFGYQEVNALYPEQLPAFVKKQRFYLSPACGIFRQFRELIEQEFLPDLAKAASLATEELPLIWDADFFINDIHSNQYELCEINASCVSPFPPSAIEPMCSKIKERV